MDNRKLWVIIAISILLFGCVGSNQPAAPLTDEQTPQIGAGLNANQLPPFPVDRGSAVVNNCYVPGSDYWDHSSNSAISGFSLMLNSTSDDPSYGIWELNGDDITIEQITIDLTTEDSESAFIAIADYSTGTWYFDGPLDQETTIVVDPLKHYSQEGSIYIAVVTSGGDSAEVLGFGLAFESDWNIITVDQGHYLGVDNSLRVVNGSPAISYYDPSNNDLKYIRATDLHGLTWGEPVSPHYSELTDTGQDSNLAIVNSMPAITYIVDDRKTYFVRAGDINGVSWLEPVEIDDGAGGSLMGFDPCLAIVDGKPAISFGSTNLLKYVQARDIDGATWPDPVILDDSGVGINYMQFISLVVVEGSPMVSYRDGAEFMGVKTVASMDSSGINWYPPQPVDCGVNVPGINASGALVSFGISVSYWDQTGLEYARYDMMDEDWVSVVVDNGNPLPGTLGYNSSLAIIDGKPAISYYDHANSSLKYVRAIDVKGDDWGIPVVIDSIGEVGQFTSLAEVDGKPAISYYDLTNGNLKYAINLAP